MKGGRGWLSYRWVCVLLPAIGACSLDRAVSLYMNGNAHRPSPQRISAQWQPWQEGSPYNQRYAGGQLKTIEGRITAVATYIPSSGAFEGLQLTVEIPGDSMLVHVGPRSFARASNIQFNYGDAVRVNGSQIVFGGAPVLMARRIERGGDVLLLRDDDGRPLWCDP